MKKKILLTLMIAVVGVLVFGATSASAATYGDLTYTVSNGEVAITDCSTSVVRVEIPETIEGYPVTTIEYRAFAGCDGLISVTIPDSVTTIGDSAFDGCDGLISIIIPNSVTTIGDSAFYGCDGLTSVTIPDSVTTIEYRAFSGCDGLTSVTIPNSVTTIGDSAFSYCTGLTSVTIPDSVTTIGYSAFYDCIGLTSVNITSIEAWCKIAFSDEYSNPLKYAGNLYLNDNLVTNLTIPNSVTTIGNYAFSGCDGLTGVTIPNSVTTIKNHAFSYCTGLTGVTIPNSVTTIGNYAFSGCDGLTSVTIPDSVTTIGNCVFYDCTGLTSVTIGSGVELIPESAFYVCYNLKSVCLPSELLYIRNDAFNSCPNIETVFYAGSESQWNEILFYNRNENLTDAKIVYNATKKTYKFDTNCGTNLPDITDYAIFTSPTVKNDGKTLVGWYDNKALSGDPVTFPYYGSATTLYAQWTDRTGTSFEDAFVAKANQKYTITTTTSGQLVYFEFAPTKTKEYRFYSTGSKDTYGYLYNSNKAQLISDDDDGDGNNFYISYKLTAGETYYIAVKCYSGTGTFTVVTEDPEDYIINSITLKDVSGNESSTIPTGIFMATVSFTNIGAGEEAVIVLAQYSESDICKGLMYVNTEDVPTGSTIKLSLPVDNTSGDIAKLRAFVWESFRSMLPMGNSVTFPIE